MGETTTIRIDRATHEELKRLAQRRNRTVAETVSRAVRTLRQEEMGRQLAGPLDADEVAWLDAHLG
jgi:predicted transcriptional regulator